MKLKLNNPTIIPIYDLKDFAVILCGGGAAGRWQAGVLVALAQTNILEKAKVMIGTSVGGLNAGLFCAYGGNINITNNNINNDNSYYDEIDELLNTNVSIPQPLYFNAIEVWESITKNEDVYKGSLNGGWDNVGAFFSFIFNKPSLLDPTPLYNRIDSVFGKLTLEDISTIFNRHLIVSALDLNAKKEEFYCSFGSNKHILVADALKRTSAIPGIFKSVKGTDIDSKNRIYTHWHVDGGAGANNPLVALGYYNQEFPNNKIKKVIIIYCYPDIGTKDLIDTKNYEGLRDVLIGTLPGILNSQEQMVEEWAKIMVKETDWDILALYPSYVPCNSLDFTKTELLQKGYDYCVAGKGYSYKDDAEIDILDFLRR